MNNRGNYIELKNRIYILEMYKIIFQKKREFKYIIAHILEFISEISNNNLISLIKKNFLIKNYIIRILLYSIYNYQCPDNVIEKIGILLSNI